MTVTVYRSTDASAPAVCTNAAGQLVTLLDAVLVNGYGSKAAAGWSIAYTGTNKRAYRGPAGSRMYLRVDDSAGGGVARVVGYETMSDVDTGTGPFPTAVQMSGGLYWYYNNNNASARPWMIVATDRTIYMNHDYSNDSWASGTFQWFGDFVSYKSGDAYNCSIYGNTSASASYGTASVATNDVSSSPSSALAGHYIARTYAQTGTSITFAKSNGSMWPGKSSIGANQPTYPDPVTGYARLARHIVIEPASPPLVRGYMPGLWIFNHNTIASFVVADTLTGSAGTDFSGKVVEFRRAQNTSYIMFETSNTW